MRHTHYFPRILPVDGEDCIAKGHCECGFVKYFIDYYGETKDGISLKGLEKRVDELNKESEMEFASIRIPIPPRGNRALMRSYYGDNRARIVAQVSKYGFNATSRRLRVSRMTLYRIIKKALLLT